MFNVFFGMEKVKEGIVGFMIIMRLKLFIFCFVKFLFLLYNILIIKIFLG